MNNEFELVGILSTITVLWALGCIAVSLKKKKDRPMATKLSKKPMATRRKRDADN